MSSSTDGKIITETLMDGSMPVFTQVLHEDWTSNESEVPLENTVRMTDTESEIMEDIEGDPLLSSICISADGKGFIPLSQQFDFKAGQSFNNYDDNQMLLDCGIEEGYTLWDALHNEEYKELLKSVAERLFPNTNPLTNKNDLEGVSHPEYIPLVLGSGSMYPQYEKGKAYFNPEGSITVSEFLDSLVAIKVGRTSGENVKKSLDGMSDKGDFYNEGYNNMLKVLSSPFYRLYTREELMRPITRLDLAYLTVVCWEEFTTKFDALYSGRYDLGVNVNWNTPQRYAHNFEDGTDYRVFKKCFNTEYGDIIDINVGNYKGDSSMTDFKQSIQNGSRGIPLPMFMSLFELHALDLFPFNGRLDPLKEVSREELCIFLVKLAKVFSSKFISYGDVTE